MAAAIVVPMFWERGSLIATAFTPIIVAIVSEALNRPAKVITAVAPRVTRRSATGAAVRAEQPTGVGARGEGPEQVSRWGTEDDPFGLREPPRRQRRFPFRLAVITGLLAAVIGAGVVTASELAIFGHQIGNSERSTGLLGGKPRKTSRRRRPPRRPRRPRPATPTATPTETATETPTADAERHASPTPTPTVRRAAAGDAEPTAPRRPRPPRSTTP